MLRNGLLVLLNEIMDEVIYLADGDGGDGVREFPVTVRGVRAVDGSVVQLQELAKGDWQAATVARCVLPDGTPLALKMHTESGGMVLVFSLVAGGDYYY